MYSITSKPKMGQVESNDQNKKVEQLAWPEMNKLVQNGDKYVIDTLETRHRGFVLASAYAACIGRTAYKHPKSNQVLKEAIALKKAVTSGDMAATQQQMNKTWRLHTEGTA